MGHLSKIAQGVFIGNGEVWNFLDYAVNRDCGSLISYTQNKNFLRFNFFNNFNGGGVRRYYNSDIAPTVTYGPVVFSKLKGIGNNAVNDDIGELYSVTSEGNSTLKFVSNEDFSTFQKSIRELQLLDYHKIIDDAKAKPEHYFLKLKEEDYPVYSLRERGDEYNVPEIVSLKSPKYNLKETSDFLRTFALSKTKQIREKQNVSVSYSGFTVSHPVYQGEIGAKVNDRLKNIKRLVGLTGVADEIRNGPSMDKVVSTDNESFIGKITPLVSSIKQNSFITEKESFHELYIHGMKEEDLKSYKKPTTTKDDLFSDGIDTSKLNTIVIRSDVGLESYYADFRSKCLDKHAATNWKLSNPYGVTYVNGGNYTINKPRYANETDVSDNFNGGGHVKHKNEVNTTSYTFFEEFNGSETLYNFEETSVADGSSVSLSDYSGASILLKKTNELFRNNKIKSLVNRFHTDTRDIDSEFITSFDNNFGLSRGRNLVKKQYSGKQSGDKKTGYDDPYCRVWTAHKQYSKLKDRIRPFVDDTGNPISLADTQSKYGDLRPKDGANRLSTNSVLKSDGYVSITPTNNDGGFGSNFQKYMFSLENLAWKDAGKDALSVEQRGPKGGRIMWFPPYNLKFSENVSVNWNANSFIGRGEDIYSYINTLRSGTLDFTLLIDHPSILNKYRGTSLMVDDKNEMEQDILRYFAGCGNLNDEINVSENIEEVKEEDEEPTQTPEMAPYSKKIAYVVFFPNNFSGYDYFNNTGESNYTKYVDVGEEKALDKLNADFPNYKVTEENFELGVYPTFENEESVVLNNQPVYRVKAVVDEGIVIYDYYAKPELDVDSLSQLLMEYNNNPNYGCSIMDEKYKNQNVGDENKISYGVAPADFDTYIKENVFGSSDTDVYYYDKFVTIAENFKSDMIFNHPANEHKIKNITFRGFASSHGAQNYNEELCNRRQYTLKKLLNEFCASLNDSSIEYINGDNGIIELSENVKSVNDNNAKVGRMAVMIIEIEQCEDNTAQSDVLADGDTTESVDGAQLDPQNPQSATDNNNTFTKTLTISNKDYTYDNEYLYFSSLRSDSLEYKNIVDKVRFFEPAFHSITPEGFNSRLTFLHQCTRQGPTNAVSGGGVGRDSNDYLKFAGNLSFGRAPYCILRIGDFFNTKICIDSLSITYDNNGVQWDLNPEGAGVQPMFANVSISFKFIGGQDISGPVERLQNAVTSNYYANASVYSRHADDENLYYDAIRNTYGNKV